MAFQFIGVTYTDFVPDGEKTPIQGYKLFFLDDIPADRGFGRIPFSYFLRPEKAAEYGFNSPTDMVNFASRVGNPVDLSFDRKGKITGWNFPDDVKFPAEPTSKPNKL